MSKIVNLDTARRDKAWEDTKKRGEGWDDATATVTVVHDPDDPGCPIIRTDTAKFTVDIGLTREEARVFAYRLLNIANAPHGINLRGHSEGDEP